MNNQNKQFEENMVRLFKANRDSNMPTEKFTNDLINDVLHELEADQGGRQKSRETMNFRKLHWMEIAAVLVFCGGFVFMVFINLGQHVNNKMESISSEVEKTETPPEQPQLPGDEMLKSIESTGTP
jgi:hypothetical protein